MKTKTLLLMGLIVGAIFALAVPLPGGVKAVLYKPDSNPSSQVGVIIIHRTSNYLNHAGCTQLSQRGLTVLCMNSRFDNNEALVNWELIALDVRQGVNYLKNTLHLSKVILFGHSAGSPLLAYYANLAANGNAISNTDVDAGTTLVYSISGGLDAAKFNIDSSSRAHMSVPEITR